MDNVNSPAHYMQGKVECIDAIIAAGHGEGFCAGNAIKYLYRYDMKNGIEDVLKAQWYVNKLVEILDGKRDTTGKQVNRTT